MPVVIQPFFFRERKTDLVPQSFGGAGDVGRQKSVPDCNGSLGPATAGRERTNLPRLLQAFIGRERELAEIEPLLPGTRLRTLTGTGGIGKTCLALQAAAGCAMPIGTGSGSLTWLGWSLAALVSRAGEYGDKSAIIEIHAVAEPGPLSEAAGSASF